MVSPRSEKQAVALSSTFASAGMAAAKFVVGGMSGSLGVLSEAAHSLLDFGATVLTYAAVRAGDKPPDAEHPYGHAKIEALAALGETVLLFVTAAFIVREAIDRLRAPGHPVEASWWLVGVMVASIVIDWGRSRALMRVARTTGSAALEADALHFSSDMWSSAVVLVGVGLAALGFDLGDPIAALGVAAFVCHAGWDLGRRTIAALIDTAPAGAAGRIAEVVQALPTVARVEAVRVRPVGATVHADVRISVSRALPPAAVRETIQHATTLVRDVFPEADVVVRAEQVPLDRESVIERVRAITAHRGFPAHHVTVQTLGGRLAIAFDLEVPGRLPLAEAHALASALEEEIRAELGPDTEIDTHLEPLAIAVAGGSDVEPERLEEIVAQVRAASADIVGLRDVHDVRARLGPHGLLVNLHCHFRAETPVEDVHAAVDRLEARLLDRLSGATRVVIHAEPAAPAPG